MNILYITEAFPTHEKPAYVPFLTRRIHALQAKGHKVTVLSLRYITISNRNWIWRRFKQLASVLFGGFLTEEVSPDYKGSQFKIHRLSITKIGFLTSFSKLLGLWRYFSVYPYDIVHAHFLWFAHLAFLIKKYFKIPLVISIHGDDIYTPSSNQNLSIKKYRERNNKIIHIADKVIFVSHYLKDIAIEYGYNAKNSIVIYNGIDPELFYYDKKYKDPKRKIRYIAYIGDLYEAKGANRVPLIFSYIQKKYKSASFLIIGCGDPPYEMRKYIKRKLRDLKLESCTRMTGEIAPQDIAEYMRKLDVLILPSDNEGFGCVVVEARACGVPVVATDVGGVPEAIGSGGLLVKKQSNFEATFADAVLAILKKPPSRKKIQARILTWEQVIQKELNVYNKVLQ